MPSAPWGVPLHCDLRPLKTPTGIIRILLVVSTVLHIIVFDSKTLLFMIFAQISSAACILCEFSAGTVQVGLFFLPLIGRLRLMVFCAIFSLLLTSLMVFLDISHIALMFPFNWPKLVTNFQLRSICISKTTGINSIILLTCSPFFVFRMHIFI